MRQKLDWMNLKNLTKLALPANLQGFLADAGSFMQRLKAHDVVDAKIQVLSEGWQIPRMDEREILKLPARQYALVREVIIFSGNKPWMKARTVVPKSTLTGKEQLLARLKTRPLGSILFKNPQTKRSAFQYLKISADSQDFLEAKQFINSSENIFARRSVFHIDHKNLLLTEIFLPSIKTL